MYSNNQYLSISQIRETLRASLCNRIEIIHILKSFTASSHVELFWYEESDKCFLDKIENTKIPIKFFQSDTKSMIGFAYKNKMPYRSSHLHYDTFYNIAIDNPFKLTMSAQLILPILSFNSVIGIIRFSKEQYTFHDNILRKLYQIEDILCHIFSKELDDKIMQSNHTLFSINSHQIDLRLHRIRSEIKQLYLDAHNPEMKKIIEKAEESLRYICDYIHLNQEKETAQSTDLLPSKLHILIADDVKLNVKILNAMLKGDSNIKISFAYDGIEALEKIEKLKQENNPVDILYLDHYMPGKLGLEIAQTIRKEESSKQKHKITIISITNDPNAIKEYKHLYDYQISKPFLKPSITSVMESIKKKKKLL